MGREHLGIAIRTLRSMDLVLLLEDFAPSGLALLHRTLGWTSVHRRGTASDAHMLAQGKGDEIQPEDVANFNARNQLDLELMSEARTIYTNQLDTLLQTKMAKRSRRDCAGPTVGQQPATGPARQKLA